MAGIISLNMCWSKNHMQNITSIADLKSAIQLLEVEQVDKAKLWKNNFYIAWESIKPANIIANTLMILKVAIPYRQHFSAALNLVIGVLLKQINI